MYGSSLLVFTGYKKAFFIFKTLSVGPKIMLTQYNTITLFLIAGFSHVSGADLGGGPVPSFPPLSLPSEFFHGVTHCSSTLGIISTVCDCVWYMKIKLQPRWE